MLQQYKWRHLLTVQMILHLKGSLEMSCPLSGEVLVQASSMSIQFSMPKCHQQIRSDMVVNPKIHSEKCLTSKFHPKFGQNKLHYHKLGNHVMGDDISFGFRLLLFSPQARQCSSLCLLKSENDLKRQPVTEPEPMSSTIHYPAYH